MLIIAPPYAADGIITWGRGASLCNPPFMSKGEGGYFQLHNRLNSQRDFKRYICTKRFFQLTSHRPAMTALFENICQKEGNSQKPSQQRMMMPLYTVL
jgi:hypothetical protein